MNQLTVAQMILEKLDELGADGLMFNNGVNQDVITKEEISEMHRDSMIYISRIPAYHHADGSYHAEKECPCPRCFHPCEDGEASLMDADHCDEYQSWLSHKEAAK